MKKICNKCGKIIGYTEKCCCINKRNKLKPIKKNNDNEASLQKDRYKWNKLRKKVLDRDNYMCQRCLIKYGIVNDKQLEVHHIKSRKHYPELKFEIENVITLCRTCNLQLGTTDKLDFEWCNKTEDNCIIL